MMVINAFNKLACAILLKTKTSSEVTDALEPVLRTNRMKYFQTDDGKEYYNSAVHTLLNKYAVKT